MALRNALFEKKSPGTCDRKLLINNFLIFLSRDILQSEIYIRKLVYNVKMYILPVRNCTDKTLSQVYYWSLTGPLQLYMASMYLNTGIQVLMKKISVYPAKEIFCASASAASKTLTLVRIPSQSLIPCPPAPVTAYNHFSAVQIRPKTEVDHMQNCCGAEAIHACTGNTDDGWTRCENCYHWYHLCCLGLTVNDVCGNNFKFECGCHRTSPFRLQK